MFNGNVMQGNYHDCKSVIVGNHSTFCLCFLLLLLVLPSSRDEFVLNQKKSLHSMVKGKLMLSHLRENGTDVQMNFTRVRDLKALINWSGLSSI